MPYKVKKTVGGKRKIEEGEVFVRHGSQVEHPTEAEMAALIEEGDRVRRAET